MKDLKETIVTLNIVHVPESLIVIETKIEEPKTMVSEFGQTWI
jgi:hypothetical protein